MIKYSSNSIKNYLDDLAAKKPAPGGGSAAALTGALGAALLSMVCNYTIGKDKYKGVEAEIKNILEGSERIRKRFLVLVDLDVEAYYKVSASRKAAEKIYQKNLLGASGVPLEMCALAVKARGFCPVLASKANKYLISDVYVAEELLKSCFKSAQLNVKINLAFIKDENFVLKIKQTLKKLKEELK